HLAPGLLLERLHPLGLRVALPGDHVELALAGPDLRWQLRAGCRRAAARRAAAAGHDRHCRDRQEGHGSPRPPHLSSSSVTACCGSQANPTRRPRAASTSAAVVSAFWRSATSVPPSSRSTTYRVTAPR